jgi:hypothetical protein
MRSDNRSKRTRCHRSLRGRNGEAISACALAWAVIMVIGWTTQSVLAAGSADIADAELAAGNWLSIIDVHAYDEGWRKTTGDIRHRDEQTWIQWMRQRRGPLGNLLRRTIVYAGPLRFARGDPPRKYIEIEYDTDFEAIADLFEYVRMERIENGSWAVSWYFVRQHASSESSPTADFQEQCD